jgi:hypothetical protein
LNANIPPYHWDHARIDVLGSIHDHLHQSRGHPLVPHRPPKHPESHSLHPRQGVHGRGAPKLWQADPQQWWCTVQDQNWGSTNHHPIPPTTISPPQGEQGPANNQQTVGLWPTVGLRSTNQEKYYP